MSEKIINLNWSVNTRENILSQLKNDKFDILIIGGGITGAGIAREAALRGLKTAIIDREDFAFGTSSRSSKLAHGGFRYLSYGEFKLVREATTERNWLRNHFTHNVRPLKMFMVGSETVGIKPYEVKIGIRLYDFLSNFLSKFKQYGHHRFYKKEKAMRIQPNMREEGLEIIGEYYDTNVDDARLTIETIKEAITTGDVVALNYFSAESFNKEDGKIVSVNGFDHISGEKFPIFATHIVNATGIWTDELLHEGHRKVIRPTKGVHVVVPANSVGNVDGIGLKSIDDGRTFFVLNREDITLIGTTDTDYSNKKNGLPNEDLSFPYCSQEDCDYLFRTVNFLFPKANLTYDDIISTYAGVRPLVMEEGKDESEVSRKHVILDTDDGLTTLCGGKLTTFRKMAEDLIYHLISKDQSFADKIPTKMKKKNYSRQPYLVNLTRKEWDTYLKSNSLDIASSITDYLYNQYGMGAKAILEKIKEQPDLGIPFIENHPFIPAEIHYILEHEMAIHLFDVLRRRTEIFMKVRHDHQQIIAEKIANLMAPVLGWDESQKSSEIRSYLEHIKRTIWF